MMVLTLKKQEELFNVIIQESDLAGVMFDNAITTFSNDKIPRGISSILDNTCSKGSILAREKKMSHKSREY